MSFHTGIQEGGLTLQEAIIYNGIIAKKQEDKMAIPLNDKIRDNYPGLDKLADNLAATYDLLVEIKAWCIALAVKLNADAGVTDVDYDEAIASAGPDDPDA
jgi:hypothetical protein